MKCILKIDVFGRLLFAIAGALLSISPNPLRAQGQSQNVLADSAEFHFRVRVEDSECKPLIATNETESDVIIEKILFGVRSDVFVLTDLIALPKRILPGETISLGYACFRPKIAGNKEYNGTLRVLSTPIQTGKGIVRLQATSYSEVPVENIESTSPTAVVNFDPATKDGTLLSMVGKDEEFMRAFNFKNISSKSVTINSIDFQKQDGRFDITTIQPGGSLPMDIAPGESFSIRIAYRSLERTPVFNRLLIYSDDNKEPVGYDIRGLQLPLSQLDWNKRNNSENTK